MSNIIPKVPKQNTNQSQLWLPRVANPYAGVWWTSQTVTDVPENIMGWLVAQGFEVTNIRQDRTTNPPTNYFSVRKEGLTPRNVLLSLCNSYTIAANEARTANEVRYNQILANMSYMVDSSHLQFDAQVDEQNLQSGVYLADLDQYMTAIEAMIADNQAQVVIDAAAAKVALEEMVDRVADLETNATNNANDIAVLFAEQDTSLAVMVSAYDTKLAEIDQNYAAYLADILGQIASLGTVLDTHVADFNQRVSLLLSDYQSHASDIETQLSLVETNVNTHVTEVGLILASLETDYADIALDLETFSASAGELSQSYVSDYSALLTRITNDYSGHANIARAFLVDLGQEELARINEDANASLTAQMQLLVSKGLYQSTIPVDVTARNARDKEEKIQMLNDRLNREKLENQHRLYEQQASMRARVMDGKDRLHSVQQEVLRYQATLVSNTYSLLTEVRNRVLAGKQALFAAKDANAKYGIQVASDLYGKLRDVRQKAIDSADRVYQLRDVFARWKEGETVKLYEQIQAIEGQFLESIQRQYAAKVDVTKTEISERDALLAQLQSSLNSLMTGKERYAVLLMQNANALAEHKHRAIVQMMNTAVQRLEGWSKIADQNRTLMAYQLDERNKLLMGLYSFVERREDTAPEWRDMAQMIAGLSDSGGGWLTPN